MSTWFILWPFEIFYGHWVYFVVIWYIFPRFGMLYLEKSGNPVLDHRGLNAEKAICRLKFPIQKALGDLFTYTTRIQTPTLAVEQQKAV
jgi:hypothetical protein